MRNSAHNVFNPLIDVQGDRASGHWRLLMLYTVDSPDRGIEYFRIIGCYRETYRRVGGRWLFESLHCDVEEHGAYPATDLLAG